MAQLALNIASHKLASSNVGLGSNATGSVRAENRSMSAMPRKRRPTGGMCGPSLRAQLLP
jgi:hypothetical protein